MSRQHVDQGAGEGPDVHLVGHCAGYVEVSRVNLLRCHEVQGAFEVLWDHMPQCGTDTVGDAKVTQDRMVAVAEKHVAGLQVTRNDVDCVQLTQAPGDGHAHV